MALISDGDLFCIERQGRSYKWTGAELNLQIQEISPIAEIVADLPIEVDLTNRIVTISIRDGTIYEKGAVKLTNTVNNSETLALTPKGAKTELDKKANLGGDNATGTWPINITGNADTATFAIDSQNSQRVYVKRDDDSNANRYLTFVDSSTAENKELSMDNGLSYNPLSNVLTTSVFKGNLNGIADRATQADNATNAVNATNATNVIVINDGSDKSRYLTFASMASGADRIRTDGGLRYNPFNNIFSTTNIELSGYFTSNTITTNTAVVNDSLSVKSITGTSIDLSGEIKARSADILTSISAASADLSGTLTSNNISTVNIVASEVAAKNVTLTSKIKAATAEITGSLSASNVDAKTGDFSGNVSAKNVTLSGNLTTVNATVSNKLNGKNADFSNNLTAKSASISAKMTAGSIEASSGKITNTLTTGSLSTGSFGATSGSVTNKLTVGSISGGSATFTGKLTSGSADINGALEANSASISGALSSSSASVSGNLKAGSAEVSGRITAGSGTITNLTVGNSLTVNNDIVCKDSTTTKTLVTSEDAYVGRNLIVRKGSDNKSVIYNDGSAYFADEKIWFYNTGDARFVNLTCSQDIAAEDMALSGSLISGSVSTGTITSSTITTSGRGQFGSVTTGTVTASTVNVSGNLSVSKKTTTKQLDATEWLVAGNITSDTDVRAGTNLLADRDLVVTQNGYVGGSLTVRRGNDPQAVIYNDGGAYFANEKIWLYNNGNVKFIDANCRNITSSGNIKATTATFTNLTLTGSATVSGSITSSGSITAGANLNGNQLVLSGDAYVGRNFIVRRGSDHQAVIYNDGGAYFSNEKIWLYNNGNVKFTDANCRNITSSGNISTGTITSGAINASGTITSPYGSFTNAGVATDLSVGRNINCGHIVNTLAFQSTGDVRVGGNFIVQTGDDKKAVIYNDGSAYFADTKIWLHGSGDIECRDLNSKSDRRFKTDIQPVSDALTSLKKLNGVKFKWTDTDDKSMGVIAQDVEEVFPELVSEKEEFKSVNYNGLVGALIEAVKELSARVEELENTK